jgi:hypothetical protein
MEDLMFGTGRVRRFTQDSPVLPDVWLEYAKAPGTGDLDDERLTPTTDPAAAHPPVRLLLTPYGETAAAVVARTLRERLKVERARPEWRLDKHHDAARPARIVYNQSTVAAELYLEDLLRIVLPMTDWWQQRVGGDLAVFVTKPLDFWVDLIKDPERSRSKTEKSVRPEMLWMMRVVGVLVLHHENSDLPSQMDKAGVANATDDHWREVLKAVGRAMHEPTAGDPKARIYSVSLNRQAAPTVFRSTLAVKADAARRLFAIDCAGLAWAVIDSGIDARHPAFLKPAAPPPPASGASAPQPAPPAGAAEPAGAAPPASTTPPWPTRTRVRATYDFNQLDLLLDPEKQDELPERLTKRMSEPENAELKERLSQLYDNVEKGRSLDFSLIAPLLEVPHDDRDDRYRVPRNDHGTHVAGILAGRWCARDAAGAFESDLEGMCPDLQLYDLRVLDDTGRGDEFAVIAALQFVRHLNTTNDYMAVHGVNLSMSIPHDVSNYACGRTPVCDECEHVVRAGVVVVAAAGNQGYRKIPSADGSLMELYSASSITDPGNAEQVITVGATHRYRPHMYGVSYFSSRGPTGDGRLKPDLVAPGEKITSLLPDEGYGVKDGTSMAAPHVSGAAALLMARHNELVGQPDRVKKVLCSTATDLGRERYFQGAGMLDVLRALQSV